MPVFLFPLHVVHYSPLDLCGQGYGVCFAEQLFICDHGGLNTSSIHVFWNVFNMVLVLQSVSSTQKHIIGHCKYN